MYMCVVTQNHTYYITQLVQVTETTHVGIN